MEKRGGSKNLRRSIKVCGIKYRHYSDTEEESENHQGETNESSTETPSALVCQPNSPKHFIDIEDIIKGKGTIVLSCDNAKDRGTFQYILDWISPYIRKYSFYASMVLVKDLLESGKLEVPRSSMAYLCLVIVMAIHFKHNSRDILETRPVENIIKSPDGGNCNSQLAAEITVGTVLTSASHFLGDNFADIYVGVTTLAILIAKNTYVRTHSD